MSDVTFTPEQVKEIRRRIEEVRGHREDGIRGVLYERNDFLAAFPLPKVTRFRTFTMAWDVRGRVEKYRVNGGRIEYSTPDGEWSMSNYGRGTVASFAELLAARGHWTSLAALADVAARPTEEVDA